MKVLNANVPITSNTYHNRGMILQLLVPKVLLFSFAIIRKAQQLHPRGYLSKPPPRALQLDTSIYFVLSSEIFSRLCDLFSLYCTDFGNSIVLITMSKATKKSVITVANSFNSVITVSNSFNSKSYLASRNLTSALKTAKNPKQSHQNNHTATVLSICSNYNS